MKLYKLGRFLFGSYFVYSGINHLVHSDDIARYARSKKLPKPKAAVIGSGVALIAGGTSLALGFMPKIGAASVAGFLAAVTPTVHAFWKDEKPEERMHDMADFTKNIALASGALAFAGGRRR